MNSWALPVPPKLCGISSNKVFKLPLYISSSGMNGFAHSDRLVDSYRLNQHNYVIHRSSRRYNIRRIRRMDDLAVPGRDFSNLLSVCGSRKRMRVKSMCDCQ